MTGGLSRLTTALAGRYRLERELGAGGMATVYLAHDLKHDRKVAIKVLKPELAAVLGAERFVVEIKTTASLQHPHMLPILDSGTAEGDTSSSRNRMGQSSKSNALLQKKSIANAQDKIVAHGHI